MFYIKLYSNIHKCTHGMVTYITDLFVIKELAIVIKDFKETKTFLVCVNNILCRIDDNDILGGINPPPVDVRNTNA